MGSAAKWPSVDLHVSPGSNPAPSPSSCVTVWQLLLSEPPSISKVRNMDRDS